MFWVIINISMVCEQAVRRGGFHNVTYSMWLVLAFQTFYVADALYNEVSTHECVLAWKWFILSVAGCIYDHGYHN